MASEVEIPESLVAQAPRDSIRILKKEKEEKNDSVIKEGNDEHTHGECFLYTPSVGEVATEAHQELETENQEEIEISDSMGSENAASGEFEAEIEHVKKGNEETNTNVSNHKIIFEVEAVEVPLCVPNQTWEIFEKDKKSESNAEIDLPLDSMTLAGKVEALITEGEMGRTAFSSVESGKDLTSQNEKEAMEAIQPPESSDVEEKVSLQRVGEDIRSEEESRPLFEEIDTEKDAKLKDELTVINTNAENNDDRDMGSDETKTDTEVTTEENLKEISYEPVSNTEESLETEEQHLGLVPACSEKEIGSELVHAEECIEKEAVKQMETEKKCEEETATMISEDILAYETTKEILATEEGETELVVDSEIQEKDVDNFNAFGVPEYNISKNENDFSYGRNEAVDSLVKEDESQEKQETEDPFEEETQNSNASEEGQTIQPVVLEGSSVETATEKDLYSETSEACEKSQEILISGDETKLEVDDDECGNLPMQKEQHESAISEEENTHEVSKNTMRDSNARELVWSLQDEKSEERFEDGSEDAAEDNMDSQKFVEETSNPERSPSPLEEPPLENPKQVVFVQEADACQHENDEPRDLDKASLNFDQVTNEENNNETKEEITDSLRKEEIKASDRHNTSQENKEKVEAEICQTEGISSVEKRTSEEDDGSDNQITDAEKEITATTSAAHIVVEENDMDGCVVNGTKSTGSEDDIIVTGDIEKVHNLDEIIDKEMVTSEEHTTEESVDKHTEDEKPNIIQETDEKTEDVPREKPTEVRTSIDEKPSTESMTSSGGTEKEKTNQVDRLNESTLAMDIEDNIKGQECAPVVVAVVSDEAEVVEDDVIINETSGDANSEGEQKQVTSVNIEAVDATNISNDGLEVLKGKEVSDGDNYYQENDGPVSDEVCAKENTEPADAIEKSGSCLDSATANKTETDKSQAVKHEDDEPVMNNHLEEHGSIAESDIVVDAKESATIEVGQKVQAREVELDETQIIEREVEEDVLHIEAETADDEDKSETVKEDSSQHCNERDTTESDKNELPKDGQEKEQVRFDDIHGKNLVEDAEIGAYISEENSSDKLQVCEVQDEANKELENVREENSNSIIDVVSAKEISESFAIIDKNDQQTNLEAENNISSFEADRSEHLSQEVHKEQGLSATQVVTEIKDKESENDKGNSNKIIDAVEVEKLECEPECRNLTDPSKDETNATGITLNDHVANCDENVIMDKCGEEKTLSEEDPKIILSKVEDETQLIDELETDKESQVMEGNTKEEDFQHAKAEETTQIMSEMHKSDENIAEESLVLNDRSAEVQTQQISAVAEATEDSIDEQMAILDREESHEPTCEKTQTVVVKAVAGIDEEGHTNENDVSETRECDRDETEEHEDESFEEADASVATTCEDRATSGESLSSLDFSASNIDIPKEGNEENEKRVDYGEHKSEIVKVEDNYDSYEGCRATVDEETSNEGLLKEVTGKEEKPTIDSGEELTALEVRHSSEDVGASEFDVTDDKTEEGKQGTHGDDITNKIETVSNEVTTHETCSELETTQPSEDTVASELEVPLQGITEEKLENVSSEAAQNTASDVKDDVFDEMGAPNVDKMSQECVPIHENQSPIDVSNVKFEDQQVDAEERIVEETETVNMEVKETSLDSVSKGCESIQESPLPENTLKEDIEEKKQGEISGEIACKPEIMKVQFKDDMPEETSAKTDESSPLEESQSSKDVPVSEFNTPTEVENNSAMESSASVPPNASTSFSDSEECHSKLDILNEDIADIQKHEEMSNETACETETLNAEIEDVLPEETDASLEKMTREAIDNQHRVVLDETESKTETVNVEVKVDVSEEPDSLSIEKASEGMPSQEDESPDDVLNSNVNVLKEGDQEVKENDFDEAACEAETVQAQFNNDLIMEGASEVEVNVDLPDDPDSLSSQKEIEGAPLDENQSNGVETFGFDIPEEDEKQKGDDSHVTDCEMETADAQVQSDLLEESGASEEAIEVVLPEEQDSLSEVKISEESVPSGQSQSSEQVLTSTFNIPREGDTKEKRDDSNDISCEVAPLLSQVTDDLLKEPEVSNDADATNMSEECAALEGNQSSEDVRDSEFYVPEGDTKEVEKHEEVCREIDYQTNIVNVGNKGNLSEETSAVVNEKANSQEPVENVTEITSQEQLEQLSSSLKMEHEQEAEETQEKQVNVRVGDETERQVDDSNVESQQSMDTKQVPELDITGITDKSSMSLEFEGGNQPSNNSESVINSLTQETTTETELEFSSKSETENQEQNATSNHYDQELTKSEQSMEEKQCEETNEIIAEENQSEMECEKHEAATCDTDNEKNTEPVTTLEKQNNSSEASGSSEKTVAVSDANCEEISETSAEDKTLDATQTAKELESSDECPGGEPTQDDFQQATREITDFKVYSVDSKDDVASKLDEVEVQKDVQEHEGTECNEVHEPSSVKDKEVINPGSDDVSDIDKPNQQQDIKVEATELHLDSDKNIQNHDDSIQISSDIVQVVQVQEREEMGAQYHIDNVSEQVEKQKIFEKEEPREQENIRKGLNMSSNVENEEEITASDVITREIDVRSSAKVEEDESLASRDANAHHSAENLTVDGTDGGDKSQTLISAMSSQECEELSAADIIANQISLDIEREERQQQLSSEQLEEQEASGVDVDNRVLKGNTVVMNFDEDGLTELGVPQSHSECGLVQTDLEEERKTISSELVVETQSIMTTGVDKTTCDAEKHEDMDQTSRDDTEAQSQREDGKNTERNVTLNYNLQDMDQTSRDDTEAQSQGEDGQNTEISPEDDEKQYNLAKENEIPEEKVLCHDTEGAPQHSQNESHDNSESAVKADDEHDRGIEVNLSSIASQKDDEPTTSCIIQPLDEKQVTIESPDNIENVVTAAGERNKGARVDLSSIASQKDKEATKSCIVPHMPQVEEQMLDQKQVSMEDNKDKDLYETREMEGTRNDPDDTVPTTVIVVDEEKLLENHFIIGAQQDQSGSCPTENTVKETLPIPITENSSTQNNKIDEKECLEAEGEQTNDTKTGSIATDSTNISLSDIIQTSSAQTCQTDEEKRVIPEEKTTDTAAEEPQSDEEDDVDKAPFVTEAMRDYDIKATNKKSNNILSGVGSKVKHSISKVKKAITCSSSQFASDDVIVKLNKNKKS